jgi:hypothetical protein
MRLPTFLIIGAAKAGTSTLYGALRRHPAVYFSPVKEPHFFSFLAGVHRSAGPFIPENVASFRTMDEYATLFEGATEQHIAIGEASTGYLCQRGAPELIRQHLPDARLIALMRDPAERAWSEYRMVVSNGLAIGDFRSVSAARPGIIACGDYARLVKHYLTLFPREQLLLLLTDDLAAFPDRVVAEACDHIGVERMTLAVKRENVGVIKDRLPAALRSELVERFRPGILELEEMLRRDLAPWLDPRAHD